MRPELSILSFLCVVLLLGLTFLHIKSRNVAILTFIAWLLVSNIVQGVNSVLWSADRVIRAEVWCDISSKLLLGSRVALPAACTCICAHLHFLSSTRNTKLRPHRTIIELTACLIIPLIYMALHTIVQDHRFILAEDFGCVSSIFVSVPAVMMVWIPPLLLSLSSIIYAGLALWRRMHRTTDRLGLSSRLITFTFLRPLFTSIFTCSLVFCVSIFDVYAASAFGHGLQPWSGLSQVHATLSEVYVVAPGDSVTLARIETFWWVIPVSTLAFSLMSVIGLLLCATQESSSSMRSAGKWFRSTVLRQPGNRDTFVQSSTDFSKRFTLLPPTPPLPVHLSGWDDTLRSVKSKPKLPPIACDIPMTPTSPSDSESESDASFKASTLAYLQSPTGRETLGFASLKSPPSGPISQVAPRWSTLLATPAPILSSSISSSPANSILSSPWPRPPSTVLIPSSLSPIPSVGSPKLRAGPTHTPTGHRYGRPPSTSSLTGSISSSIISTTPYLADPDIFLHNIGSPPHRAPFQDAGIPSGSFETSVPSSANHKPPRRVSSKESFHNRSLSLSLKRSGGLGRKKDAYGDAVYMTVVQETQAV